MNSKNYALKTNCDLKVCAVQGSEYLFCNKGIWCTLVLRSGCLIINRLVVL